MKNPYRKLPAPRFTSYSLKAACSHCDTYGWVDDQTLICGKCGKTHEITEPQRQQRDSDFALWSRYTN